MQKQSLSLTHNYRPPSGSDSPPPAIFMLHGYGSDENDLFSFAAHIPEKYAIISFRAPLSLPPYGNAWYTIHFDTADGKFSDDQEAIQTRDLVADCVQEAIDKYVLDASQITLLGFSQGCILSFAVALSYPGLVDKVIGLSGYVNPDILKEGYRDSDHSGLKVYTSHGSVDQVIPVQWARNSKPFFDQLGIPCHYSEFPVGHGVAPQNFQEFINWLQTN
jgi:phospholipase/carboxylesterase